VELIVAPDGAIRCLYDETLDLSRFGRLTIARGSHVEPTVGGVWTADLGPVGGPLLGPYPDRSSALDAERRWLEAHWLVPSV
jgi:hypothetical protein